MIDDKEFLTRIGMIEDLAVADLNDGADPHSVIKGVMLATKLTLAGYQKRMGTGEFTRITDDARARLEQNAPSIICYF